MLDDGQPAIIGRLGEFCLVLGNILKADLLVLVGIGINGSTSKGGNHLGFAFRCYVIALQLEIGVRGESLVAAIGNFPSNINQIGAAFEGEDLGNFHAIGGIRFQTHGQFIGAFSQRG